jgi:carbon monoxide dehydrogenase subunit G
MGIKFEGEFTAEAPRDEVYAFLSDPQKFGPCLPTFENLEMKDEKTAEVTVRIGVGKIKGNATIQLVLAEENPPERAAYDGKGKVMGGAFNMATSFELEDAEGGGTVVKWFGDLSMFGKLVALAGGLIRPIAKKDIQRLVDALQAALARGEATGTAG